jgi:hypothetical protein
MLRVWMTSMLRKLGTSTSGTSCIYTTAEKRQVVEFPDFWPSEMSVHFIPYREDIIRTVRKKIRTVGNPVVVSVLATGPKVRGFEPGQGYGFLRAIKIRSTPSFGWEVKPEVPCSKTLRHIKDLLKSHGDG